MKITETCSCGARFEIEGNNEMSIAVDVVNFRDAHEICRSSVREVDKIS